MRLIYSVLFYSSLPFILLRLFWRSLRSPGYRKRWPERFGFFSSAAKPSSATTKKLWLHSVSVGETIAAKPLVDALLQTYPTHQLIITTMTPTGSAQVQRLFADAIAQHRVLHSYIPYDLPDCVQRFLNRVQPQAAIFMETEVWPNILAACEARQIPAILVNARLSERSLRAYQRFSSLANTMFSRLTAVAAQTAADGERLQQLGVQSLTITGSLKSEIDISQTLEAQAQRLKQEWSQQGQRTVIIAASTHRGEDELLLTSYQQLLKQYPSLLLVIVPRHPERFASVYQLCVDAGFCVQRRSLAQACNEEVQIILGDTMGELMLMYGAANIAIVGGSFIEHGGHNLLEPAVWGLPILTGASVFNFAKIVEDMEEQAALLLVNNQKELIEKLLLLLTNKAQANSLGGNAKAYIEKSRGALSETIAVLSQYIR